VDCYRLHSTSENDILEIQALIKQKMCCIEWPENIKAIKILNHPIIIKIKLHFSDHLCKRLISININHPLIKKKFLEHIKNKKIHFLK
jgi:tRNA A37 threonylcarbamoyladenosine biosynthesis protein TsaE